MSAPDLGFNPKRHEERPVHRVIQNPLILALLAASKTDRRLAGLCSRWAIATQVALGMFVCFTALLAFGAAYYTLSTLHAPGSWIPWIAILYGIFIGVLDREIVGGLDKTTALIRPVLSLFIGTIIAIPIELWVFQARIDQDLQRQYRQDNREQFEQLDALQTQLEQRRDDLRTQLTGLRKQEAEWAQEMSDELVGRVKAGRSGISGAGPVFENAKNQQLAVRQRIEDVRRDLDIVERSLPTERHRLEAQFQRREVGLVTDFVTRYEALDRVVHSSDPLYRLSWLITLTLILIEMTPALLKLLTPHADYHHLAKAEIRENVARIDEISDRNYRLAIEDPESPRPSVVEKFAIARYGAEATPANPTQDDLDIVIPIDSRQRSSTDRLANFDLSYLDRLCDSQLPLFGDMPRPTILVRPATEFDNANAHCISSSDPLEPSTIEFNAAYLNDASEAAVENTMKHELIHAWIHFKGITDSELHGHVFIMKGKEVGCDVQHYERELVDDRVRASEAPTYRQPTGVREERSK